MEACEASQCALCLGVMVKPVSGCPEGHSFCKPCSPRVLLHAHYGVCAGSRMRVRNSKIGAIRHRDSTHPTKQVRRHEMNACVKTTNDRFQVKTKPLTQKDIENFFRPRSGRGSCVLSSDAEPLVPVSLDVEAMAALDEPVVAALPDVEVMVVLAELVAQVEKMGPKLPKRKRKCVPCQCTVPGPCCGRQYSSQATLAVHFSKQHGDQTKANEQTAHEYALQNKNRTKRRNEDPEYRKKERAKCQAYRAKKKLSLSHV